MIGNIILCIIYIYIYIEIYNNNHLFTNFIIFSVEYNIGQYSYLKITNVCGLPPKTSQMACIKIEINGIVVNQSNKMGLSVLGES